MKKKLFILILSIISVACLAIGLTACDNGGVIDNDGQDSEQTENVGGNTDEDIGDDTADGEQADTENNIDDDNDDQNDDSTEESSPSVITDEQGLKYVYSTQANVYEVCGIEEGAETVIVIPDTYNDISVTSIGENAFYNCTSLESVTIGNSITAINSYAFYGCSGLTSITIPQQVTFIGGHAFSDCSMLTEINYNAINVADLSLNTGAFYGAGLSAEGITLTIGSEVTKIPAYLFDGYISYSTRIIGGHEWAANIVSVIFEDNSVCKSIGDYAFYYSTLKSVYITDLNAWCNTTFGTYANPLNYADILYVNEKIMTGEIILADNVTSIPYGTFKNSKIKSITISSEVVTIEDYAFYNCSLLEQVSFGENSKLESICRFAFYGCSKLTSIVIGDNVTSINDKAFYGCASLESIEIGISVNYISDNAFDFCYNLNAIYIKDLVAWCGISFDQYNNPLMHAHNLYLNGELVIDLVIPNDITYIGDYTFRSCYSLECVVLPDSVMYIGAGAFYYCDSLESITVSKSVTSIGSNAFSGCSKLSSLYYCGTQDDWEQILIYIGNDELNSITIYYYAEADSTTVAGNYWYYDDNNNIITWTVD